MPAGMLGKGQGGEGRADKAVQMGYARPGSQFRLSRPQTEELTFSCANTEPHTHMDTLTTHTYTHSLQRLWMFVLRFISFLICAQPQKIETFRAVESAICCPAGVRVHQGGANIVDSRAWCRLSKWLCLRELLSVAKGSKVQRAENSVFKERAICAT